MRETLTQKIARRDFLRQTLLDLRIRLIRGEADETDRRLLISYKTELINLLEV